ncbi:MAG: nickel-dependent lactate racemase [Treponema sp.]|nr:nickel-dependent lactate racemase [Treponema sp.]
MPVVKFPYGTGYVEYDIPELRFRAELVSRMHHYKPEHSPRELVARALENPIGSPRLSVMAEGRKNIVIICSDHTRPVPSRTIIPPMLAEIRKGSPDAKITLLVSTGCHRPTTEAELEMKFGAEIVKNEKIVVHDCDNSEMVDIGKLPSGGRIIVNRLAVEADLLCAEGFIEPHFFAGFSGGRKSLFPGVASRGAVLYNHNSEFIAHPCSRTGILEGNPIHADMLHAARVAGLDFICNVIINSEKEAIFAVAGGSGQGARRGRGVPRRKVQGRGRSGGHRDLHQRRVPARPEHLPGREGNDGGGSHRQEGRRDRHARAQQRGARRGNVSQDF